MSMIDYSHLRSLKAQKLVSALIRDGFEFDRQRGSHHLYYHADGRRVTVSFHHSAKTFFPTKNAKAHNRRASWMD